MTPVSERSWLAPTHGSIGQRSQPAQPFQRLIVSSSQIGFKAICRRASQGTRESADHVSEAGALSLKLDQLLLSQRSPFVIGAPWFEENSDFTERHADLLHEDDHVQTVKDLGRILPAQPSAIGGLEKPLFLIEP